MSDVVDEALLNAYLDGEVSEAERQFVQARLAQSSAWRAAMSELMLVFDELEALEAVPLTTDLSADIVAALPQAPRTSWLTWLLLSLQLVGGLAGIVALWPTVQRVVTPSVPAVSLAQMQASLLAWWGQLVRWQPEPLTVAVPDWSLSALVEQWQTAVPTIGLTSAQWGMLLGLAFAVWVVGNGLLLRREDWLVG